MINFDTPSSNFIILLPDDWDTDLKSDWFGFKEVSIKGQTFLFLSLVNDNLITSKDLSAKIKVDLQNLIPLGPQSTSNLGRTFFITGYSQKDFKFNEYKAFLQQISPKIQVYDNISVIEANTDNCKEEDIARLSTFLPVLYPHLNFTSYVPKKRVRVFISHNKANTRPISKSTINSILKWDNKILQIYFNSNKTIADIVLNEEGEKNYKQLYQDKIISTDDYTLDICKFAEMKKVNKCKSLELEADNFPANFTLKEAYQFFSEYNHIYRIQIFNKNETMKSVIIQLTSNRIYNNLRHQKTLRYQSRNITLKPTQIKPSDDSKSDSSIDDESESKINTKNNLRISPLISRKFIDDICDEEISRENSSNDFLNTKSEVTKMTSHHSTRHFIDDVDSEDHLIIESSSGEFLSTSFEEKSEVTERGINLHLVKEINTKNRHRQNFLFISDSYSENNDNDNDDDDDESLSNNSDRKFYSSSRFSHDMMLSKSGNIESAENEIESPTFIHEIVQSLEDSKSDSFETHFVQPNRNSNLNVDSKANRLYISDEDDGNENDDLELTIKKNLVQNKAVSKRKFVIMEIDDIGSYSYSDAYTESGSFTDSD